MVFNYPQNRHRHSLRLKGFDYASSGAYFITICTEDRCCLFGIIASNERADTGVCPYNEMVLNDAGKMVADLWRQIPERYAGINLDEYVVMPNHIHGIIIINRERAVDTLSLQISESGQTQGSAPALLSLPDIVKRFKSLTTKRYIDGVKDRGWKPFNGKLWQRNYYEHVIRDDDDLNHIREYIQFNAANWEKDEEFVEK
jgi:putative transposase